jgi:hypothetical protein
MALDQLDAWLDAHAILLGTIIIDRVRGDRVLARARDLLEQSQRLHARAAEAHATRRAFTRG